MLTKLNRVMLLMLVLVFSLTFVLAQPADASNSDSADSDVEGEVPLPEPYCGDGIVNAVEEQCDGIDMGNLTGLSCSDDSDYNFGDIGCTDECEIDYSQCMLDETSPEINISFTGDYVECSADECDYYVNQDTEIRIMCSDDESGNVDLSYRVFPEGSTDINDLIWMRGFGTSSSWFMDFSYPEDGKHIVEYHCSDGAGNNEGVRSDPDRQIHIVDSQAPIIIFGVPITNNSIDTNGSYHITSDAELIVSGDDPGPNAVGNVEVMCKWKVACDNGNCTEQNPFEVNGTFTFGGSGFSEDGRYILECTAKDALNNLAKVEYPIQVENPPQNTPINSVSSEDEEEDEDRPSRGCSEIWTCEEWSACTDGLQVRECTQKYSCSTTFNRPALVQECETPLVLNETVEQPGALARITGAVIGPNGRPTGLGILIFFALIVGAYFVVGITRKRILSKTTAKGKKSKKKITKK